MKSYSEYINDPYFMKWVFQSDDLSNKYWNHYIKENPGEEKLILAIRDELGRLKLKHKVLSDSDKKQILQNILASKQKETQIDQFRRFARRVLPYAAVAVLFLTIGNILMYIYLGEKEGLSPQYYSTIEYTFPSDGPELILADGNNIPLNKSSLIKYGNDKIVIDDKDVLIPKNDPEKFSSNQLIIPNGSKNKLILSDNTIVYLNAGSRLIYPSSFKNRTREVQLIGEAFFEVAKNETKPFVVKTSTYDIRVYGTSFNVSAYPDDEQIETVLVEGKVSVTGRDPKLFDQEIMMKPNQLLSFDKHNKDVKISNVDVEYYTLWKSGMLKFEDEELAQIIRKIERLYDLSITVSDLDKEQMKISGKLNLSENSADVFEYLSILTKMNFEKINEKNYVLK